MDWNDVCDIAIELAENYPEKDPYSVNFVDLRDYVMGLENFSGEKNGCNERILEAIQAAWHEEVL